MGQYYTAVSLDTKQAINPFGAKLMEHSWLENSYMKQVERLLSPEGPWHKTSIVWTGDYSDKGLFTDDPERNLYDLAANQFTQAPSGTDGPDILYIVNHTKRVYIDLSEVPDVKDSTGWKIHPLSILTSSGNGRGGGDYKDDEDENVGSWAGDIISSDYVEPIDMEKYNAFFVED